MVPVIASLHIPGESVAVLQANQKASIRKMSEVFPFLADPLWAAETVGAQMQPCLEEEAGPAGPGDSRAQLCVPQMGFLLWPCADLSLPDTPPRVALHKRDSFAHMLHIPHQTRREEVGGVGRMSSQKGFILLVFLSDSHFYVFLYNIGMMWDHDGKEQCLYSS